MSEKKLSKSATKTILQKEKTEKVFCDVQSLPIKYLQKIVK